ncbi:hypothetical protein [Chryseobacterium gregarium]|uniref:hypothetical protein n=1 Tax=Chryseobacterium gregarium TaxID=456299 RepID=UPI00042812A8|nr:hypothetical protein [Chryseobacterium gregarium]
MRFFLLGFLLFFSLGMSQELYVFRIPEIAKHKFEDLDQIMVSQYGFERVPDIEEPDQRVYKNKSDEAGDLMVITVIRNAESCSNAVSIVDGSAARTAKLRNELPALGYRYAGKKKMPDSGVPVSLFVGEHTTVSITDRITGTGAYQVVLTCKQAP